MDRHAEVDVLLPAHGINRRCDSEDPRQNLRRTHDEILLGIAHGICIVAGLVEVQAMADPHSLDGLTGIYYSLTYLGFALACATIVARALKTTCRPM